MVTILKMDNTKLSFRPEMEIDATDFNRLLKLLTDCIQISSVNEENTTDLDVFQYLLDNVKSVNTLLKKHHISTKLYYDEKEQEILKTNIEENISRDAAIDIIKEILVYSSRYRIFNGIGNMINNIVGKYGIEVYPVRADAEGFGQEFKINNNNKFIYFNPYV